MSNPFMTEDEHVYWESKVEMQQEINTLKLEIGELKWMLRNANSQADDFCKKSIELQKRIDDLNNWCTSGVTSNMLSVEYNRALLDVLEILKGTI